MYDRTVQIEEERLQVNRTLKLSAGPVIKGAIVLLLSQTFFWGLSLKSVSAKPGSAIKEESYKRLCIDAAHYMNLHQSTKAIAVATKGIKLAPQKVGCYRQRGLAYMSSRQYAKAIKDLTKCTKLLPEFSYLWSELGFCYLSSRNHEKAFPILAKSIALDPNGISSRHNFIGLGAKLRREKEARAIISKARSANHNDLSRAILYENKNQSQKALLEYNKYLRNHKDSYGGLNYRGNFFRYRKDYKKALADFDRILTLDPSERNTYYARAKTYQLLGKPQKAIDDCSTIIYILSGHADAKDIEPSSMWTSKSIKRQFLI